MPTYIHAHIDREIWNNLINQEVKLTEKIVSFVINNSSNFFIINF